MRSNIMVIWWIMPSQFPGEMQEISRKFARNLHVIVDNTTLLTISIGQRMAESSQRLLSVGAAGAYNSHTKFGPLRTIKVPVTSLKFRSCSDG